MKWKKSVPKYSWVFMVVAVMVAAVSACTDIYHKEPCLVKGTWAWDDPLCAKMRKDCWDPESNTLKRPKGIFAPNYDNIPFGNLYEWEECVLFRQRYPWDNPFPDAGTDGGEGNLDGGNGDAGGGGGNGGGGNEGGAGAGGSANMMMDGGADASASNGAPPEYTYSCIPRVPDFFNDPQPVWFGPTYLAPKECPYELGAYGGFYYFGSIASKEKNCPQCACKPPTGECATAIGSLSVREGYCNELISSSLDLSPLTNWNGTCSSETLINIDGSNTPRDGVFSAKSIQAGTLALPIQACKVVERPPAPNAFDDTPFWMQTALSCNAEPNDELEHADWETCIPSSDQWRSCVRPTVRGKYACDLASDYSDRFIVYPKDALVDNRTCSPCECSPVGGSCAGELVIHSDEACMKPIVSMPVDSDDVHCQDIPPNTTTLGGKTATKIEYVPGMCDSRGGKPSGQVEPDEENAVTWCCLRLDYVRPPLD